ANLIVGNHFGADPLASLICFAATVNLRDRLLECRRLGPRVRLGCAGGEGELDLLEAEKRVARVGHADLALVDQVEDVEAAGNLDRAYQLSRVELGHNPFELGVLQLLELDPIE